MEKLNLDNELLKPIKNRLENAIDILTKNAVLTKKEAEITLKINISVFEKSREFKEKTEEYLEPIYEFQLSEKIKESKDSYKGKVGFNHAIMINDDNNLVIESINKQESLFAESEDE